MILNCDLRTMGLVLIQVFITKAIAPSRRFMLLDNEPEDEIVSNLPPKTYLPKEIGLQKIPMLLSSDNDATYLLSKLSDEELIKLLKDQPKKNEYDLQDVVMVAAKSEQNDMRNNINEISNQQKNSKVEHKIKTDRGRHHLQEPVFKLNNKKVDPFSFKSGVDPKYLAFQKIQNMLYSAPDKSNEDDVGDVKNRELLFDLLIAQLKELCCKKKTSSKKEDLNKASSNSLFTQLFVKGPLSKLSAPNEAQQRAKSAFDYEHIFLIINDDIANDGSDDLIAVDPDSLNKNSSVLLLGPITTPLTDSQLKLVMQRITNEISKPDYLPLLKQISDGSISKTNSRLLKSLVSGSETRRYIKAHRCNHQSLLTRIYNGPKWIICTGYLNLNTPSLYDK